MTARTNKKKTTTHGFGSRGTESPNTLAPGVSGAYIHVAQKGDLQRLSQLRKKLAVLESNLGKTSESLSACNDPDWLDKFAKAHGNHGRRFNSALIKHVADLEKEKANLLVRKEKVLNNILQISGSVPKEISSSLATPLAQSMLTGKIGKPRVGPKTDLGAQQRDLYIMKHRGFGNRELCTRLDFDLSRRGDLPIGFPKRWHEKFAVATYTTAYEHPECKSLVQKLISKAKRGF